MAREHIPLTATEVKNEGDRTWRVFKVNSEREEETEYLVEVASYGNTHCTCYAYVMGSRRPCKHISFVLERIAKEEANALGMLKGDLIDSLMDDVLEYARPQPDPNDKCTIDHRHYSKCRAKMTDTIHAWVKKVMSTSQEVTKQGDE